MTDAVLAIDLGTSATKLLLVDRAGSIVARQRQPYPTRRPVPDAAEQDPATWWAAIRDGIRSLARAAPPSTRIAGIGLTGQMHGLVVLDADGTTIRPAITWQDRRSEGTLPDLLAILPRVSKEAIRPGYQAASWHWLSRHERDTTTATVSILLPKDEITRRLTGVRVTDPSDAIGTGWFDPGTGAWDPARLHAAGVGIDLLPDIAPSGSVVGRVSLAAASALGLEPGLPVVLAGGDAAVGAFGAGATAPGTPLILLSTGCQVLDPAMECPASDAWPAVAPPGLSPWLRVATTRNGGNVVSWARFTLGEPAAKPDDDLVFLPYLDGERSQAITADAAGAFIGLRARHTAAEMSRAAIDGAALAIADAFARAGGQIGTDAPILAGGGGVRDATWLAAVARAFGRPVLAITEPDLSAWGGARSAATALGWIDPVADPDTWTPPSHRIDPPGPDCGACIARLRRFQQLSVAVYGASDGVAR